MTNQHATSCKYCYADLEPGYDCPCEEAVIDRLERENERLRERASYVTSLLESLTPGGSEFYGSPDNCARWIRDRLSATVKQVKKRKEAEAELERLTQDNMAIKGEFDAFTRQADELRYLASLARRNQENSKVQVAELEAENERLKKQYDTLIRLAAADDINSARACYDVGYKAGWEASAIVGEKELAEALDTIDAMVKAERERGLLPAAPVGVNGEVRT